MTTIAIIPARYASTRFPGKPLADLGGRPVVEWVYRGVCGIEGIDEVCVATDDTRICDAVQRFGGKCVMTRSDHKSGTERCAEVVKKYANDGKLFDVAVNVQGDEPFVNKEQIAVLLSAFRDQATEIATLAKKITSQEELISPNNVKVVVGVNGNALYFSRTPIPYIDSRNTAGFRDKHVFFKHVGIYAYRIATLENLIQLDETELERCEKLEQLRWLEHGYSIKVMQTENDNIGIDTPYDLQRAREAIAAPIPQPQA